MENYDAEKMELSTRDVVARANYTEVQEGRGSEHGGVYLDITHLGYDGIMKKLPTMYEQFLKLADIDISREPMEVFPTVHYTMGGIKIHPETAASSVPGLYAAGEVAGGTARRQPPRRQLIVRPARLREAGRRGACGLHRGERALGGHRRVGGADEIDRVLGAAGEKGRGREPYLIQQELQEAMMEHANLMRDGIPWKRASARSSRSRIGCRR